MISGRTSLVIVGTYPGVLLRVGHRWDLFVRMRLRFAVGSLVFIIAGALTPFELTVHWGGGVHCLQSPFVLADLGRVQSTHQGELTGP
jgi:hypothetical protein